MVPRLKLMLLSLGLAPFVGEASAQSQESYPHAKDWVDDSYGHSDPWFSATFEISHRQTPDTTWVEPIGIAVYSLQGRLHFNPRLALVSGIQWGGYNKLAARIGPSEPNDAGVYEEIDQEFSTFVFDVGADIGMLESKYFHLQAGPRLGVRTQSTALVGSEYQIGKLQDIEASSTMLHLGAVGSAGAFIVPFVEVGLRLQADYGLGGDGSGMGFQMGGYTTAHF